VLVASVPPVMVEKPAPPVTCVEALAVKPATPAALMA